MMRIKERAANPLLGAKRRRPRPPRLKVETRIASNGDGAGCGQDGAGEGKSASSGLMTPYAVPAVVGRARW